MNQSFQRQQLIRLCKKAEYIDYGMTINQLTDSLDASYEEIANDSFDFSLKQVNEYFLTKDLPNKLILRKLNDNIKRIYKDEQANRRIIISQVKTLLSETCPFWVIKTDIKRFYESIDRERMISKFQDDSMLSYQSRFLLKKVFENPILTGKSGVPRGMNISATMSELYMRKFDKWIRTYDSVYYYARFVDDIIIFSNSIKDSLNLIADLNPKLNALAEGLSINQNKTELFDGRSLEKLNITNGNRIHKSLKHKLDYLGYSFSKRIIPEKIVLKKFQNINKLRYTLEEKYSVIENNPVSVILLDTIQREKYSSLIVSIADKKVKKIKTRIIKALLDFSKNKNFDLLEKRIQFLTGNYSIRKSEEGNSLRAGIYYNYLQVTNHSVFIELNQLLRKSIFSRNLSFGAKISLSRVQKNKLSKYCFIAGFENKVHFEFSYNEMQDIIKCW
ncbi:MAG: RNA-directed DNA polymerase [Chitinophagales bacterium]|nr:RNA-directed DNA polymerase [Chitinophagales bacterium]